MEKHVTPAPMSRENEEWWDQITPRGISVGGVEAMPQQDIASSRGVVELSSRFFVVTIVSKDSGRFIELIWPIGISKGGEQHRKPVIGAPTDASKSTHIPAVEQSMNRFVGN